MKKKVLLRAPALSISGYGVHSRQVFRWLESRLDLDVFVQVLNWGDTSWMVNSDLEEGLVGRIMDKTIELQDQQFDVSFQLQLPDEWDTKFAKKNIGMSAVVETDVCNPEWIKRMNMMDEVIVPTNHNYQTIMRTEPTTTRVHVIPESYIEAIDKKDVTMLDMPTINTDFNFLLVGQFTGSDPWNDRKNIFLTIKWFCEAFADDPDVGLIIKANHGRGTMIDRAITKNTLKSILSEVRSGEFPKIHLIHGNLSPDEMAGIYRRPDVKCLISLTRGEGFGLPIVEAAASGVPVMATNWSGHLDFLNLGKFIPIKYKLIEIPENRVDNRIFLPGMKWADPNEQDFKVKVKKFRNKYQLPKQWAEDLASRIRAEFSLSAVIEKYNNFYDSHIG